MVFLMNYFVDLFRSFSGAKNGNQTISKENEPQVSELNDSVLNNLGTTSEIVLTDSIELSTSEIVVFDSGVITLGSHNYKLDNDEIENLSSDELGVYIYNRVIQEVRDGVKVESFEYFTVNKKYRIEVGLYTTFSEGKKVDVLFDNVVKYFCIGSPGVKLSCENEHIRNNLLFISQYKEVFVNPHDHNSSNILKFQIRILKK